MEFIDLKAQQQRIRKKIDENIAKVLDHGQYILGPEVQELETKLANFVGVKHCIGVSSGTDALLISLMALGIKAGDEVITTSFSFVATAEVIVLLGAKPVFVDINPKTYNINADLIAEKITSKTRAIIPVSLYGQCADFDKINTIANKYNLPVIEDGAESFGAEYKNNKSCSLSTVGITSFFPAKPLGCYGDGGACFTNNDELALKIRQISKHGQDNRYHSKYIGVNGRLDTLQAAILLAKLGIFKNEIALKEKNAKHYYDLLKDSKKYIKTPYIENFNKSVYGYFPILVSNRDKIFKEMIKNNIPVSIHFPPIHKQLAFEQNIELSHTENIAQNVLTLPMHPYLTYDDQITITETLKNSL